MPRDTHWIGRRFMVDQLHLRTGKKIKSHGPFSEKKARQVATSIEKLDARCYADIRRATKQEEEQ